MEVSAFPNFSDARNPFVEFALQYVIAAAIARFDKTKKEELQKLLLLGKVWYRVSCLALSLIDF